MKYILDFDGVIFNTKALKEKMKELGIEESSRSASLFEEIKAKDPSFEIENLMFEDARKFLMAHQDDCEIVSSYLSTDPNNNQDDETQKLYQEVKIELSGALGLIGKEHVHVVGKSKMEALAILRKRFDEEDQSYVFIDDRKEYVQEAEELGIPALWMKKEGRRGSFESWETHAENREIESLDDLQEYEQIWQK